MLMNTLESMKQNSAVTDEERSFPPNAQGCVSPVRTWVAGHVRHHTHTHTHTHTHRARVSKRQRRSGNEQEALKRSVHVKVGMTTSGGDAGEIMELAREQHLNMDFNFADASFGIQDLVVMSSMFVTVTPRGAPRGFRV